MSYRGPRPRGPRPMGHDFRQGICMRLGIPYPPDFEFVHHRMMMCKSNASDRLNAHDLEGAFHLYTDCILCTDLLPATLQLQEERCKLLCNRSLVLTKRRMFREAENDAHQAIMLNPNFVKAYWRIAQAVKGGYDGPAKALPFIIGGLTKVMQGHGTPIDVIDFLTELCTFIPKISAGFTSYTLRIDISLIAPKIEPDDWTKVLQKLSTTSAWQSIAMLITGQHSGLPSALDGIARNVSCTGVSVGSFLLKATNDTLNTWGEKLAVQLIRQGALVDEIGHKMNKPTVHVATEISLITRQQHLLECILEKYKAIVAKKNAQNSDGATALHILVKSGQASTTHGLAMLQLLLKYKLDPLIEDKCKKIALDYLGQEERAFVVLKKATRTVEELRQDLEKLKARGTEALKAGKLGDALKFYRDALEVSQQSKQLYKEAAILYSNCANVFFKLGDYTEALANCLAAISCDSSYAKGHWWKGKVFIALGSFHDAFHAFIDGCSKSSITSDTQLNFIMEAVLLLKQITSEQFMTCYSQLPLLHADHWPQVLVKLSMTCEWKVMAYLILGSDIGKREFETELYGELIPPKCTGVAKSASLRGVQLNTVFKYLEKFPVKQCIHWLDPLVVMLYCHGGEDVFTSISQHPTDTPLHALVRYSLITGSITLMKSIPEYSTHEYLNITTDGLGNSLFHSVAKLHPIPAEENVAKVLQLLLDKGYSSMDKDRSGKMAVEYLDSNYPGYIYDMFFQSNQVHRLEDLLFLKTEGNKALKRGSYPDALDHYTNAIQVLEMSSSHAVSQQMNNREVAVLYGNRAEVFLKMYQFPHALEDAKKSVSVDGHWYKGHLRVGKALRGLFDIEEAMKAFINAYRDAGDQENVKLEILMELCDLCPQLNRRYDLKRRLPNFPVGEGHMWARAAHKLVTDNNWNTAQLAYHQYCAGNAKRPKFTKSLQPLCNLRKLKGNSWGVNLILFFLESEADRFTITVDKGDTYLHAVIRIELVAGKSCRLLEHVLKKFCSRNSPDQHKLDSQGNTALHTAASETGQSIDTQHRHKIIILLLKHDVDPNIKNKDGKLAMDYLPYIETQCKETLRMAMYGKENMPKYSIAKPEVKSSTEQRPSQLPRVSGKKVPKECDSCEIKLSEAETDLEEGEIMAGYQKMAEILRMDHTEARHEQVQGKVISKFFDKLGESANPEIPKLLIDIQKDFYLQIIERLAARGKWRQVDALVRKYRAGKGSDQLKGFASEMSVVPVISDGSLKGAEEIKLQIVSNLLNSGATFGSDNGIRAIQCAQHEGHYKVVTKLIREGADTTSLKMASGDTPIHAAVVIVLEKEKVTSLLEFLLDLYQSDPVKYSHLDPEQMDDNGDCLFHLLAKAKYSSTVMKVTEMLCNRNLSANYFNKDGKLPAHYVTRKNDRRLQFLKLAGSVKPTREQEFRKKSSKPEKFVLDDEDLQQFTRTDDTNEIHEVKEVYRTVTVNETRKRSISDLIRNLPDSKLSVFRRNEDRNGAKTYENDLDETDEESAGPSKKPSLELDTETNTAVPISEESAALSSLKPSLKLDTETNTAVFISEVYINKNINNSCDADSKEKVPASKSEDSQEQMEEQVQVEDADSDGGDEEFIDAVESVEELSKDVLDDLKAESIRDSEIVSNDIDAKDNGKASTQYVDEAEREQSGGETVVVVEQPCDDRLEEDKVTADKEHPVEVQVEESDSEDELEEEDTEEDFDIDAQVFDNLEWEVECTAEVWKTLRDKHVLQELKRRIVHKIQLLAMGQWQHHLCKKLKNVPPSLKLFEAKFSKGSRIIWELAIAFSPRLSEEADSRLHMGTRQQAVRGGRIYSEIIRVWEIVLDHDKIHRTVEKIKRSHDRGEKCIIQKTLKGIHDEEITLSFAKQRYPRLYAEGEDSLEILKKNKQEMQRYFPPASANDTEYHILKFYSFSSVLVSHILQNVDTKVDFPFRVTDLEHAIINLQSKAPILLLGRSGTGKTTCCLYRLWSQFHTYWNRSKTANAPLLPRCVEFVHQEMEQSSSEDEDSEGDSDSTDEDAAAGGQEEGACAADDDDNQQLQEAEECDHLHQIFITKNSVLCSEVQKNFRELSHADELMEEHVQHEEDNLPARLQDLHDYVFPLFLTSRQLLLMLDASIGPPHFFERKDDGSLKVDIAGWSDMDGPLSILPLLDEDSDMEEDGELNADDEDEDMEDIEAKQGTAGKRKKVDPRREVTYAVFAEEIWPRIKKGLQDVYHPSLIWMEIMSFIKGSFEALSKRSGYLQLDEYEKLGRKRAPNFSGQRDVIYNCFKRYDHFKTQHSLFDETDLVHNVFLRLQQLKTRPWVIHQVFVDETQDFTQAELCLMIRLCQNPNDMFLTGDTAQSIMRGIAFRFSDLRSLFFHAKKSMQAMGKTSAVEVPKQVYQLTHNYRSHAGILALASSILELMVEFFPESFDRLQPDQGLFNGPRPILLESCSFSDLAVLLRGNKRKTSHIEFGAHQAIIVVSDAAREAIPEELRLGLVLTIYEAKGLEFDDVLLYNFFKDSQASKEWRVVTAYLEKQREAAASSIDEDNLVVIDEELLSQKGRPRPLNFDPNQHKVLNSELKHLYTALTRARVNVWIFDEDMGRRAPMFEFFKARKLVKSLTVSEINEESLSETVFAEKSSPGDWLRRGEDFMKHHLYQVAAKCFGMGDDRDREKVALAHHQALMASRLKANPKLMCTEFLVAAEMYLECNKPAKAAVCLQNAREKELAAELFEKLGQFERAADIHRKLKQPIASSRCYEQLGNFNKAIEVLYENEEYVMAMDTLRRYSIIIQDYTQRGLVPLPLLENKPADHFTEEKLSHRAAELFHRNKHEKSMLEAVDRFKAVDDQVQFLEKRGYIAQAANCLKKHGQIDRAAILLLKFGRLDESVLAARETLKEAVIASHLLATCRILMSKKKAYPDQKHLEDMIKEAIQLFQTCNNNDGYGQASLLQAQLTGQVDSVRLAWKAFASSLPVRNEAGLVECADWLVTNSSKLEDKTILQHVIESIGHVFKLCQVLLDRNPTPAGIERLKKLDQFYGIQPCSQDFLAIHPLEKPMCLNMLKSKFKSKLDRKQSYVELATMELRESVASFLLSRCHGWLDRVSAALHWIRDRERQCEYYQAGLECPNEGNIDRPCFCLHKPLTKENLHKLIGIDILFVEYEHSLQEASSLLNKNLPETIKEAAYSFIEEGERDLSEKFHACQLLLGDVMPAFGHQALIGEESKGLVRHLRDNDKVLCHFKQYLMDAWKDALKEQRGAKEEKRLKCKAVRETAVFLLLEFGYRIFGFDHGKRSMPRSPREEITALENDLDEEVLRKGKWDYHVKKFYYTLMIGRDIKSNKVFVECIARRFTDAYGLITRPTPDPFEAVFKFNKFMVQLDMRREISFFPDMKDYLFWIEFYTVLAILVIAKLKSKDFPDFVFVLPSSYLHLVKFVEATFPSKSYPILESIDWWQPSFSVYNAADKLQERLKFYGFAVSGHAQQVHLMNEVLKFSLNDPTNYCLVERLLVLAMTLVCNIGKAVPVACEISLIGTMSRANIPAEGPQRLSHVIELIRESKGEADVASALSWLIQERKNGDEVLLVNRWKSRTKHKIESNQLKDVSLFAAEFFNPKTILTKHSASQDSGETSVEDVLLEPDLTEEEMQKGRADKQAEMARNKAARVILRFFKRVRCQRQQMHGAAEIQGQSSEADQLFTHVTVTAKWCGICGLSFEKKLEEEKKFEGNQLDLKDKSESTLSPQVWPTPTSPEQTKQLPFNWGTTKDNVFDNPDLREKRLHTIRQKHEEGDEHLRRKDEFSRFHVRYKERIQPQINKFKEFLNNQDFMLTDKVYREKNYERHLLEIDRVFNKCSQIQKEIQLLVTSRLWSKWGRIDQTIVEVDTDLCVVRPYVEDVHAKLKKEEEEKLQAQASASGQSLLSENLDEEEDEFEQVVEEPKMAPRHQKRRNKSRKKRHN